MKGFWLYVIDICGVIRNDLITFRGKSAKKALKTKYCMSQNELLTKAKSLNKQ